MASAPGKNDPLTPSQRRAVAARGNVLVMAGAGTGKTKTLVDRCLDCLERDGAQIDELLIVTFTEAAAAEMRARLRKKLEEKIPADSTNEFWAEQLARFDLAHIGTLHSFCLKLVREHFFELGLDPQLAILDEGEARQLANETLDEQFAAHYEGKKDFSAAVQELVQVHGNGRDEKIRALILRLHHYSQARPDAAGWLAEQREHFSFAEPAEWRGWLLTAVREWREEWLERIGAPASGPARLDSSSNQRAGSETGAPPNEKAAELAGLLSRLKNNFTRENAAEVLGLIAAADATASYPKGQAGKIRAALGGIFDEAEFLHSLAVVKDGADPLAEDWNWVRGQMATLLRLAEEFGENFLARKRTDGVLDFHDLEQFALKLLWDFSTGEPTAVAEGWRAKLKFVFVDEYQDINAAQDKIIQGLSRGTGVPPVSLSSGAGTHRRDACATNGNRFLVGDVKQSIYRFRLADPKIFRDYARHWRGPDGETISLADNFRSREGLLNFVNSVCGLVMRGEIGGVDYDANAALKFGSPETRGDFSAKKDSAPRAELLVRFKNDRHENHEEADSELSGLGDAEREARLVAWRLKQLVAEEHEIFDDEEKIFRPVEWRDIAILLRSPRGKSEIFAKEFERANIPLAVARGGFYQGAEILDLLSLLQLLDNPLQDVPCIAVLRSPFVGLSLDELAEIRLAAKEKHFWTALVRSAERGVRSAEMAAKVSKFLEQFSHWRKLARQISLSQCLEHILAETFFADWLRAQPRGAQRAGNIAAFLNLAQSFDQFQRQGLFRFLKFIEAEQAAEVEPEVSAPTENAVRLMSIHQSKGLEFPVVVLADLAKRFNEQDLSAEIIFDEEFGLCPKIKPPHAGGRYPSLPHWRAQRRQKRELRGEELRLLYVALTRARDNLILTASVTEKNWEDKWNAPQPATVQKIVEANSFADWLQLWFSHLESGDAASGVLRWQVVGDAEMAGAPSTVSASFEIEKQLAGTVPGAPMNGDDFEKLRARLEWNYPFAAATQRKAKASVTALRREAEELDEEAERLSPSVGARGPGRNLKSQFSNFKLSAADIGKAHHKFLQFVALEKTGALADEAARLVRENYLSADERAALDLSALENFWNSALGKKISAHAADVRRELPFTARFSPAEIENITGRQAEAGMEHEFIVVQGVADLAVILPDEIWLVDFKTDAVTPSELPEKIKTYTPQLQLYAAALGKIFGRQVSLRALHFLSARRTEII